MRAIVAGREGGLFKTFKDSNIAALPIIITEDDGGVHALSTATVDVVLYSRGDRNVTPTATLAATVGTAANGACTLSVDDSVMTMTPGDYYAFVRRTLAGAVTFCKKPFIFRVS